MEKMTNFADGKDCGAPNPDTGKYEMADLTTVLNRLVAPDGCPWDREQTHASIRRNMIEEAYEAVDAIDSREVARIVDELGDVLLQVLLHAAIAEKNGSFELTDVTDNLCRKLISRHTHIFGDDEADSGAASLAVWEKNKMKEKGLRSYAETLTDLPKGLPALMRAEKLQKRAGKAGFDWADAEGAYEKVHEELGEIRDALMEAGHPPFAKVDETTEPSLYDELEKEMGDFLFAAVNYSRLLGVEPEVALSRSNEKFIRRFTQVELLAEREGRKLTEMSLAEMDVLWEAVKREERSN